MCDGIAILIQLIGRWVYESEMERRVRPWFSASGDVIFRQEYDLDARSLVLDAGGYSGQWASDIFSRYGCNFIIFEPVSSFADAIRRRFARNHRIKVEPFGIGGADGDLQINLDADSSSTQAKGKRTPTQTITIVAVDRYLREHGISHIDLFKINIEGMEYDLLERLLDTGMIEICRDIQVQFHDFVPNAATRMASIKRRLAQTHHLTYEFPFVWENWRKN